MIIKKVFYITMSFMLLGCVGDKGNNIQPNIIKKDSKLQAAPNSLFKLGMPAVKLNINEPWLIRGDSCININPYDPVIAYTINSYLNYKININNANISNYLGIDGMASLGYDDLRGDIIMKMEDFNNEIENRIIYSLSGGTAREVSLVNNYNSTNIPNNIPICGDHYVSAATAGMYVFANIIIEFKSVEQKKIFSMSGKIKYTTLTEFMASIEQLDKQVSQGIHIYFELAQLGGDTSEIISILKTKSPNIASEEGIYISELNFANAQQILNIVQDYLTLPNGSFQNQAKKYIENINEYSDLSHLYVVPKHFAIKRYGNVKEVFKPNLSMLLLLNCHSDTFARLEQIYIDFLKYYNWISPYINTFTIQPSYLKNADSIKIKLENMVNQARQTALVCYRKITTENGFDNWCELELNNQIDQIEQLENDNDLNSYSQGLLLRSDPNSFDNDNSEFLIYLGFEKNSYYFNVYSAAPNASYYAPGSVYELKDGKMSLISFNEPYISKDVPSYFFQLDGVSINFGKDPTIISRIDYDSVQYFNQQKIRITPAIGQINKIMKTYNPVNF